MTRRELFELTDVDAEMVLKVGLPAWTQQANCYSGGRGEMLQDFFVEDTSDGETTEQVHGAKRTCSTCPVRAECIDWAITYEKDQKYRSGIFGGLTADERIIVSQAQDSVAFGLKVLDEQVRAGLIQQRVVRYAEGGRADPNASVAAL